MFIKFYVAGKPQGKQRPRFSYNKLTGKTQAYTPQETKDYEAKVMTAYQNADGGKFGEQCPVEVFAQAVYPIPADTPPEQRERMIKGEILPIVKPDCDNVLKSVLDGLNGVAYEDDSQVVLCQVSKRYGEQAGLHIIVGEFNRREETKCQTQATT